MAERKGSLDEWRRMRGIKPREYVCCRAPQPPSLAGDLSDPAWKQAAWTEAFVDIEGDGRPAPRFDTRAKMLWDDKYFYIGARLEEPHVWGTLTERNSIIFNDNDFEVFIDPDGDHHNYYEFEVNALNTIWELTLKMPYKDGGPAVHGTNIPGLRSAVRVDGTLNDPSDTDAGWSVVVAVPWQGLAAYNAPALPLRDNDVWRINFSRVEWRHEVVNGRYRRIPATPEDNWVWSPQGIIDMHRPERWGFVRFVRTVSCGATEPGTLESPIERENRSRLSSARDLLMDLYYAQRDFKAARGRWASSMNELELLHGVREGEARVTGLETEDDGDKGFIARVVAVLPDGFESRLSVDHESRIRAE